MTSKLVTSSDLDTDRLSVTRTWHELNRSQHRDTCIAASTRRQCNQLPSESELREPHASVENYFCISHAYVQLLTTLNGWTIHIYRSQLLRTARKSWEEFAVNAPFRHELLLIQVTEQRSGFISERRWLRPSINVAVAIVCRRRRHSPVTDDTTSIDSVPYIILWKVNGKSRTMVVARGLLRPRTPNLKIEKFYASLK